MSAHEASTPAARRLAAAAERIGLRMAEDDAGRLAALVDRVEAGLVDLRGSAAEGALGDAAADGAGNAGSSPGARPGADQTDKLTDGFVWTVPGDGLVATGSGPLDGWRLAVKDLVAVAGHPRRCGSSATFDAPPEAADAPVVAVLRRAGARLVGGTDLHEFAFGTTGLNASFGTPRNPAAPDRIPGGSSSGAAAVVAGGLADVSIGTDTGGSVRIPAALCGVVGFKPSFGALPTEGVWPLSPSLDHVGYLVDRTDRLVAPAQALGLLAGTEIPRSSARETPDLLRLGVSCEADRRCAPDVAATFDRVLEHLAGAGMELVDVDWPAGEEVFAATTAIMFAEAAHGHRQLLAARHHLYGADVRNRLLQGMAMTAVTYLRAVDEQRRLRQRCLAQLASGIDAVLVPTVPIVAPLRAEATDPAVAAQLVTFTRLADVAGLPAVSLPVPGELLASTGGLPVGLQLEAATDAGALHVAVALGSVLGV